MSPDDYDHIYGGNPLSDDDAAIIKRTWVQSAVDAHRKLGIEVSGMRRIGFDVADDGGDLNAMCCAHGPLLYHVEEWKGLEDELLKSATRVWDRARADAASIDYDSIGVGASAGAKFKELNTEHKARVDYRSFNAGGKVLWPDREYLKGTRILNKDQFANLKAQSWWNVANRLRKTHMWVTEGIECDPDEIISIDPGIDKLEKLITELSTPHKDYDPSGRSKVESKKDLAKRDVASPNIADAFIMAYCPVKVSASWAGAV
jgi:phage terminase large subunit